MDGQQEITKELCCQVVNKEVCSSHNDLTTRLWTPHYWCQLLMDTNNPAKIKGMTATGRRVDQASLLCRWLPFTAAWSGGQHRSMPPAEHWSIPNMPCMHRLKSLSWALENSYTVCQWILPKLKVREKKKKNPLLFVVKWIREKQGYSPQRSHPFPFLAAIPQNRWAVPPEGQDKFS